MAMVVMLMVTVDVVVGVVATRQGVWLTEQMCEAAPGQVLGFSA